MYDAIIFSPAIAVQIEIFTEKSLKSGTTLQTKIRVYLLDSLIFGIVNEILVIVNRITLKYSYMIVLGSSRYRWLRYS